MRARKIYESPDQIALPDLEYNKYGEAINMEDESLPWLEDPDAYPFFIDDDLELVVGPAGSIHGMPAAVHRNKGYYPGRLWMNRRLMSFWEYPTRELFLWIIKGLEDHFGINIMNNPEWKVEIINNLSAVPWKPGHPFKTQLVSCKDYEGSRKRSEVDLKQRHTESPMEKIERKIFIPIGWGSEHPKYMEKRKLAMSSLTTEMKIVRESLNSFERGQPPMTSIGLGIEAAKAKIKDQIDWKMEDHKWDGPGMLRFDSYKLIQIWMDGGDLEKKAIKEILIEFLSGKKKWRTNFLGGSYINQMLYEADLMFDPRYMWVVPNNSDSIIRIDEEKFRDFISKYWNPNQIYGAGIRLENAELMKNGINAGATNLNIGDTVPFIIAAERGDTELMELLLQKSPNDPSGESKDSKRYNGDKNLDSSNAPLRVAARKGNIDIVRLLMNDPRVNPAAGNNFALNWAFYDGFDDIAKLLLTDKRVRDAVDVLPKTRQNSLRDMGLIESINFERGKDPKETIKIGKDSEELRIFRCGNCGSITDSDGYPLRWDSPEYIRSVEIISRMGDLSTEHTFCSDCHDTEMQAYREEEARQMEENERWQWSQENERH